MKYKTSLKRRLCQKRWREEDKKKQFSHKSANDKAIRVHPISKKCSIKGCSIIGERHHPDYSKPKEIIWLCKKHHRKIHTRKCEILGCSNPHIAKGYCLYHYNQNRRGGIKS